MQSSAKSTNLLRQDLRRRLLSPLKSVTFYAHLVLAVALGGGAGIWYTLYQKGFEVEPLAVALLTYFPALVAVAIIDFTHEREAYLRSFGLIAAGGFLVIFMTAATRKPGWQLFWALLGTVLSIVFWWLANGEKECFRDASVAVEEESKEVKGLGQGAAGRKSDGEGVKV